MRSVMAKSSLGAGIGVLHPRDLMEPLPRLVVYNRRCSRCSRRILHPIALALKRIRWQHQLSPVRRQIAGTKSRDAPGHIELGEHLESLSAGWRGSFARRSAHRFVPCKGAQLFKRLIRGLRHESDAVFKVRPARVRGEAYIGQGGLGVLLYPDAEFFGQNLQSRACCARTVSEDSNRSHRSLWHVPPVCGAPLPRSRGH